jgi:hypothetical protein
MFPHTAWTDGIERAERYRREADTHRALRSAGGPPSSRQAASRTLRRAARLLSRLADRLAPAPRPASPTPHPYRTPAARRSTAHRA